MTDFIIATLIYHVSLSSRQRQQTRPYALIFWIMMDFIKKSLTKNKGIRARLVVLLATKGNLTNKGCNANAVRKAMLSSAELLELGN
jgi:hypothetical protein